MLLFSHLLLLASAWSTWTNAEVIPQHALHNIPAAFLAARRIAGTFLGFRVMSKAEYNKCKAAGGDNPKLIYQEGKNKGGSQLGGGIYSGKDFDTWPPDDDVLDENDMICAIVYNGNWDAIPKVSVPAMNCDTGKRLWFNTQGIIAWLRNKGLPAYRDIVRLGQIANVDTTEFQLVIGGNLVQAHDFEIDCCEAHDTDCQDRLKREYGESADYGSWHYTQGGAPVQDPNENTFNI